VSLTIIQAVGWEDLLEALPDRPFFPYWKWQESAIERKCVVGYVKGKAIGCLTYHDDEDPFQRSYWIELAEVWVSGHRLLAAFLTWLVKPHSIEQLPYLDVNIRAKADENESERIHYFHSLGFVSDKQDPHLMHLPYSSLIKIWRNA